ncbi:MAG: leucine-rich repeat domain-containing protein, partial [Gemmatimonadales bacterium]|nr:leucine-rich repeat domain-containing protein [Gemmatimonadales bacterium]
SALSGLTSLTYLYLASNSISDISALSGLTSLTYLYLTNNPNLTDIQPLLDNTGLGAGDTVDLQSTSVSCSDVAALEAKGVTVLSDCP